MEDKVIYSNYDEMLKGIAEEVKEGTADIQKDNTGQVVIYAGVFEWNDGTFRNYPEHDTDW